MAAAAAIHSARELGVIARLTEAPADAAAVAADCGLTRQGAAAILSALAGLDLLELGGDGRFQPAHSGLLQLRRAAEAVGCSRAGTAWPAAASECGDDRRGGVPLSDPRPTDRRSLPPKRRTGSQAARPARTPGARHRRRCSSLEPRHRRTRAQFHRRSGGLAGGDEEYAHRCSGKLDWRIGMNSWREALLMLTGARREGTTSRSSRTFATSSARMQTCSCCDGSPMRCDRPGGVAIVDIVPTERGDGPRPAVLYALGLMLRTSSGRIYPYSTFRRWLGQGGFEDPRRRDLPGPFPFTLITATRR